MDVAVDTKKVGGSIKGGAHDSTSIKTNTAASNKTLFTRQKLVAIGSKPTDSDLCMYKFCLKIIIMSILLCFFLLTNASFCMINS